jgi:hypothetical protein
LKNIFETAGFIVSIGVPDPEIVLSDLGSVNCSSGSEILNYVFVYETERIEIRIQIQDAS